MGLTEAEHDANERKAFAVIGHVPVIGALYAGIRAAVYEGKANHGGHDAATAQQYHQEAKLSGLGMASGVVDTATMFIPGVGMAAKGASLATKAAIKTAQVVSAGAAQGAVEYGIEKGRQEVEEGKITFGSPVEEARTAVSCIPGVNLIYDAARAASGEDVKDEEFIQSAMNTGGWFAPTPHQLGPVKKATRKQKFVPNAQGGNATKVNGAYKPGHKALENATEGTLQGGWNAAEGFAELRDRFAAQPRVAKAAAVSDNVPDPLPVPKPLTSGGDAPKIHAPAVQKEIGDDRKSQAKGIFDRVKDSYDENPNVYVAVAAVAVIALVATGGYFFHKWWTKSEEPKADGTSSQTNPEENDD